MKKFIILFTITGMLAMASCGNGSETPKETPSCDSTACADSCKATVPVSVDTLATKADTTSKK